jgi:recombination protein RecA
MSEAFDYKLFSSLFEKQFPKSLVDLTETPKQGDPGTFIETGSISLDRAIGVGGVPRGKIIEIFGMESSGKSTLALEILRSAQQAYPKVPVGYVDAECAVHVEYAHAIGLDLSAKRMVFVQESETEKALSMMNTLAKAGLSVIVLDSVPMLTSEKELEEQEPAESKMGGQAKALSSALRHLVRTCAETGTIACFINQIRFKIGTAAMFGNPETTSGGKALPFYSAVRIRTSTKDKVQSKDGEVIGQRIEATIIKNKVASPYKKASYSILFGKGIDRIADLVDTCTEAGLLEKKGAWYAMQGQNVAQGREQMIAKVTEDEALRKTLTDTLTSLA